MTMDEHVVEPNKVIRPNHQNELTEMFRETIRFHGSKRGLSQKLARKALYYFEEQIQSRETMKGEG